MQSVKVDRTELQKSQQVNTTVGISQGSILGQNWIDLVGFIDNEIEINIKTI